MKKTLVYILRVLFENLILGIIVAVAVALAGMWIIQNYLPSLGG